MICDEHALPTIYFSVAIFLILFFYADNSTDFVSGRVLARMASGKLALVPASTRTGDIIVSSDELHQNPNQFLVRTIQFVKDQDSVNDEIPKSVDAHVLPGNERECDEWPIVLCEFIGGCFLDKEKSFGEPKLYSPSKTFIMALH
jgi:hypothetical protein